MENTYIPNSSETLGLLFLWANEIFQTVDRARACFDKLKEKEPYEALNDLVKLSDQLDGLLHNIAAMDFPKNIELGLTQGSGAVQLLDEINTWIDTTQAYDPTWDD